MKAEDRPSKEVRSPAALLNGFTTLIVLLLTFDLALGWQWLLGAYRSEFGGHPDEAAHYVTGLFVKDAVKAGASWVTGPRTEAPIKFAEKWATSFYEHYPKVSLGVWPPFFYVVQSVWTACFGESVPSMLMLMGLLAAGVATLLYRVVRDALGFWPGLFAAVAWCCVPFVAESYSMVMAEMVSSWTMFGAMLALGNYLERPTWKDALIFGFCGSMAILTKGTGLALVLAAALTVVVWAVRTRSLKFLWNPRLVTAVLVIAVLGGAWTLKFGGAGKEKGGWEENTITLAWTLKALGYYAGKIGAGIGPLFGVLALAGLWQLFRKPPERIGRWIAALSLIPAIYAFQCIIPAGREERHLIPLFAPAFMLVTFGASMLATRLQGLIAVRSKNGTESRDRSPVAIPVAMLVFLLLGAMVTLVIRPLKLKNCGGFGNAAQEVVEAGEGHVLIGSESRGEGMFIAEVARRDKRPTVTVERSSKVLADQKWSGKGVQLKFKEDDALHSHLLGGKYRFIVVDGGIPELARREYHDQLARVVDADPARFFPVGTYTASREGVDLGPVIKLYRVLPETAVPR